MVEASNYGVRNLQAGSHGRWVGECLAFPFEGSVLSRVYSISECWVWIGASELSS